MVARSARLADASNPPSAATSEWARFIGLTAILQGETIEEEAHPNAYAQRALGSCLTLLFARTTGSWACRYTPGRGTDAMVLARVSSLPGRFRLRLRASPRRVRAGRRRCFTFRALSDGQPVERVLVRFAGRRGRISRTGRVRKCVRLRRARRYRATARRPGFRPAAVTVRARRPPSRGLIARRLGRAPSGKRRVMAPRVSIDSDTVSGLGRAGHDIGLGALIGGNLFGRLAMHPSLAEVSDERERGKVLNCSWQRYGPVNGVALGTIVAGWAGARLGEARPALLSDRERSARSTS